MLCCGPHLKRGFQNEICPKLFGYMVWFYIGSFAEIYGQTESGKFCNKKIKRLREIRRRFIKKQINSDRRKKYFSGKRAGFTVFFRIFCRIVHPRKLVRRNRGNFCTGQSRIFRKTLHPADTDCRNLDKLRNLIFPERHPQWRKCRVELVGRHR